jgi:hypothetical protein
MRGSCQRTDRLGRARVAPALALLLFAAGCSNAGAPPTTGALGYAGAGAASNGFIGSTANEPQKVADAQPAVNCPPVEVRRGASTLTIAPPGQQSAMTLRYQGSFVRLARECAVAEGNMVMKVGIEGRVVAGPAGGPGAVNVPLRFAVVHEMPTGMQPIVTKFVIVPVNVTANGNTLFTHVEEGIVFPLPNPTNQIDEYVVYVGFDPVAAEAQNKPAPKAPKVRPKSKARPANPAPAN